VPPARKTFVVSLRDQDGPATVHEVRTGRKARLELRDLPDQIQRWIGEPRQQVEQGGQDER
jgi:hypothetical protein